MSVCEVATFPYLLGTELAVLLQDGISRSHGGSNPPFPGPRGRPVSPTRGVTKELEWSNLLFDSFLFGLYGTV